MRNNKFEINCSSIDTDRMTIIAEKEIFSFVCFDSDDISEITVLRKDIPELIKFLQEN